MGIMPEGDPFIALCDAENNIAWSILIGDDGHPQISPLPERPKPETGL
jgi:hypothetical protein